MVTSHTRVRLPALAAGCLPVRLHWPCAAVAPSDSPEQRTADHRRHHHHRRPHVRRKMCRCRTPETLCYPTVRGTCPGKDGVVAVTGGASVTGLSGYRNNASRTEMHGLLFV